MDSGSGNRHSDTARLVALAVGQHAVLAIWQLPVLGVSRWSVYRRAEAGLLHRQYPGVYAVGHARLTLHGRWMAAVLACGPRALLSHSAAAALWDLRGASWGPIDVTAPGKRRLPGIRSHVSRSAPRAVLDGIPVTTLERTILDEAERLGRQRLRTLLEQGQHRGLLRPARFADHQGHRGLKPVTAALSKLGDEAPWTQSELERRFLELVRGAGLPEPQANMVVDGFVVDFLWPEQRLIVEVDGYRHHGARSAFEQDRRKDLRLTLAGFRVVRITFERIIHHATELIAELAGLIGSPAG